MDIEKLIEKANHLGMELKRDGGEFEYSIGKKFLEYATALSTLQAENESLKEKLYDGEGVNLVDYWMQQAKIEENGHRNCQAENEKLRAELENYRKGHCSEGGCAAEKDRDAVLAELEQVKAERDAAVSWAQKYTESIDMPCVACKHNTGDYVCTAICGNCGPMGAESCKWEFDFSGELKED